MKACGVKKKYRKARGWWRPFRKVDLASEEEKGRGFWGGRCSSSKPGGRVIDV